MEIFDGRYEQEKLLGQGAFSEVWKVKDTQTGVSLALKIYNPATGVDEDGNEMLTHEFALMVNANHKNLLRPLFFATCDKRPYLILPYCEKGNIGKMVGKMTEEEAWRLLRDCASALDYLHSMNPPILHQDIKPANILLSDNGDYMLTDFGVSTQAKQSMSRVSNQEKELLSAGTISYMAPERFSRNNLPIMANDVYSLGATAYEMLSGELPFGNDGGLLQKKGADIPELPGNFSPLLKRTLEKCLEAEPWARPTAGRLEIIANDALKHPEKRNQIPDIFSANSPEEVPQSQLNAATPPELPKGTVLGAAHIANELHGTVMGPSGEAGNPYISNGQPSGGSRKGLWIGIAVAVILALGAGAFFLLGPMGGEVKETEVAIDPAEQKEMEEQTKYDKAFEMFNQNNPDSVREALNQMKDLANNGNQQAIFEVAKTYAWIPKDTESDIRKRLLGWEIVENGPSKGQPVSTEINLEAIKWLKRSIEASNETDYKSMYWLAFYYLNGLCIDQDMKEATNLLNRAKMEAEKSNDKDFLTKITDTLEQLK